MKHKITFHASGRGKAQCPPDPDYPSGKIINVGKTPNCVVKLPYPAPECGHFEVRCNTCSSSVVITAAGRPDDPISVTVPCDKAMLASLN